MKSFFQKYGTSIFILMALSLAIGVVIWGSNPNSPQIVSDIGLNLVSEVFGIFLTVLIIDRIIKKSEESRWLPAKHVIYAKIMEIALEIQYYLSPERVADPLVVFFGMSDARPDYNKKINIENFIENLEQYHQRIKEVIDLTGMLLEPEIQTHLNALERHLEKAALLFVKYKDLEELSSAPPMLPVITYAEVKDSAVKLVNVMLENSTGTIPLRENKLIGIKEQHSPTKRAVDGGDSARFQASPTPEQNSAPKRRSRKPRRR